MKITSEQLKAARALVGWSQEKLAEKSGVSMPTVGRLEAVPGPLRAQARTIDTFVKTLERAGIVFIGPSEAEIGVKMRLAKDIQADTERP